MISVIYLRCLNSITEVLVDKMALHSEINILQTPGPHLRPTTSSREHLPNPSPIILSVDSQKVYDCCHTNMITVRQSTLLSRLYETYVLLTCKITKTTSRLIHLNER